jgi:hypothetical protein
MMAAMLKNALAAICILVVLAVAYLTLSVVVLRPPRVNYPAWFATAAVIAVLSAAILGALWRADGRKGASMIASGSGVALALIGAWTIRQTLANAHFEGYALVVGAMLVAQGSLAIARFQLTRFGIR